MMPHNRPYTQCRQLMFYDTLGHTHCVTHKWGSATHKDTIGSSGTATFAHRQAFIPHDQNCKHRCRCGGHTKRNWTCIDNASVAAGSRTTSITARCHPTVAQVLSTHSRADHRGIYSYCPHVWRNIYIATYIGRSNELKPVRDHVWRRRLWSCRLFHTEGMNWNGR